MAINNNITGKLKYIFYVVILLFFILNVSADTTNGSIETYVISSDDHTESVDSTDDSTIGDFLLSLNHDTGGIPDSYYIDNVDLYNNSEKPYGSIPGNLGDPFVIYWSTNGISKDLEVGYGSILVGKKSYEGNHVVRASLTFYFDNFTKKTGVSGEQFYILDGSLTAIYDCYDAFYKDHGGDEYVDYYNNLNSVITFQAASSNVPAFKTGTNSIKHEYDSAGSFRNDYEIEYTETYVDIDIQRQGFDTTYDLNSSHIKMVNTTDDSTYYESSDTTSNSSHFLINGSYYYYIVRQIDSYEYLIYDPGAAPPPPPPQAEDTIEWGADTYVVDDTGSYSWSLSDSNWDTWLYSKKASIYRDETMVHEVSLPTQTGTFYYTFEDEGSFTVKLRHTSALLPHKTIDTDTVIVSVIGESFISVTNNTIYINTPIGFQFSYGFTPLPISPGVWSSATSIEARKLIDGDWVTVNRWFYPELDNVTPNVLYTYTIGTTGAYSDSMLVSEGDYIFYLTDFNHGDVASTNVYTVEYQPGAPTENITTTYLNILSGELYKFDDLFTFKYGIDNTNFTSGVNYIEIYNYDHEVITQSVLLFKQSWYKDGYIFPPSDDDPTELFQYGGIVALPGNNTMRIRHDDINGSTELVHDNFTLSELTNRGFGLKLSKYEACINEPIIISVTIPSDSNLTIYSPSGIEIITYNLNASTTITYYFPVSGQYILKLIPGGETYEEARATIYISDCADDGIIEPPSGEIDDMYLNMFNFMTLPIFWGMIIFVGFIGGLSMKTNRNGDHLVSGNGLAFIAFGLLNLLAFIGMLAPYTMYAIVSTWIFAGIFFGVGRYLARGE